MGLLKFWKLRVGTFSSWALNRSGGLINFHNFQLFILLNKVETILNIKKVKVSTESLSRN